VLFMAWAALTNFATAGITFGLVLLIGPASGARLGTAMAVVTAGGLLGSVIAARLSRVNETMLVRGVTAVTVLLGVVATAHPHALVLTACAAGICLLGPVVAVPLNARLFALVPDEQMGRVQSSLFLIGGSLFPFASLATGLLVDWFSYPVAFGCFTGFLGIVLVVCLLPGMRLEPEVPPAAPEQAARMADSR
jgi:MFS family permease